MGRLFSPPSAPPDMRPALLSVVALMVLLLPLLLMTTSAQKLTGLALGVPGPDEELPPEPPGAVERISVERVPEGYQVTAAVRNTDVLSTTGDVEEKSVLAADLTALQGALATFKALDPKRDRVTLIPAADTPTEEVVRWMDAVRNGPDGPLFGKVILQTVAPPASAPPDGAEEAP